MTNSISLKNGKTLNYKEVETITILVIQRMESVKIKTGR